MSSGTPRVLGRRSSANVQKVLWLLAELQVPFEQKDYGGRFGRNQEAEYLELNPNGTVPTFIEGSFVLWESNAICRYAASRFGPPVLYPMDIHGRAVCEQWLDWQIASLAPAVRPLYLFMVRTSREARNLDLVVAASERARQPFAILDSTLREREFLLGTEFSLADIAIGVWAHRWFKLGQAGSELHGVRGWYTRLSTRPAYQQHVMSIPFE